MASAGSSLCGYSRMETDPVPNGLDAGDAASRFTPGSSRSPLRTTRSYETQSGHPERE